MREVKEKSFDCSTKRTKGLNPWEKSKIQGRLLNSSCIRTLSRPSSRIIRKYGKEKFQRWFPNYTPRVKERIASMTWENFVRICWRQIHLLGLYLTEKKAVSFVKKKNKEKEREGHHYKEANEELKLCKRTGIHTVNWNRTGFCTLFMSY